MDCEQEYDFMMKLLKKFNINTTLINIYDEKLPEFDLGLRKTIFQEEDYRKIQPFLTSAGKPNTIYQINDKYLCQYFTFRLPSNPGTYLVIGPYTEQNLTQETLLTLADHFNFSPQLFAQLKKYYSELPVIKDHEFLLSIIITFGEYLWGDISNFSIEKIGPHSIDRVEPVSTDHRETKEDAYLTMKALEERYEKENALIQSVAKGLTHKAELSIFNNNFLAMEKRLNDPVRDIKNYCIILNTLLRKGAEQGKVHPIHIDALSSQFAKEIERITTPQKGMELQRIMVKKYCLLVNNHSINGYSLPVQKVVTRIDADLTADLSLKAQAELLNVNPSYLSTLFKKETGMTLTNYVNKKRIEHAIYLLNSTNMQIQNIAHYCGIPDVNYFTKIFKKQTGKTPSEFREDIQ